MTTLDLDRIQGLVVRGYRLRLSRYIFLRIDDADAAGAWISDVAGEVLTAAPWSRKPASGLNIAFSYAGLVALALPSQTLASFPQEFREGMAARASLLGDQGDSAPANWEAPLGTSGIHVLVMIAAADSESLRAHEQRIRAGIEHSGGLTVIHEDLAHFMPDYREHFGYADGFAQPEIEGAGLPSQPGDGAPLGGGSWRPIRAGEFILGYPDEENVLPDAPTPDQLASNGSFLVYRKLYQDVAGFRNQLARAAQLYPGSEELLAAKIVGRWRDGTPIDLSPEHPDPAIVSDDKRNNAFAYSTDGDGLRCPVGAHIRRSNPRDSLPFEGKLVNRHRLIRRGIPYGDPLPEGEDDGKDRGVIFICLQASIARQFEFIQGQWLNGGNSFTLGEDQDVLIGSQDADGPHKMTVPGSPPFFFGPLQRVVTVKGGEYFFLPGINGLQFLASSAGSGAE